MGERPLDERGGSRPARGIRLEACIGTVSEEARDRDIGRPDLTEEEVVGGSSPSR